MKRVCPHSPELIKGNFKCKKFPSVLLLCIMAAIMLCGCSKGGNAVSADNIQLLQEEIGKRQDYEDVKNKRIENIKSRLAFASEDSDKISLEWQLIGEYKNYRLDSAQRHAMRLLSIAKNIEDEKAIALAYIALIECFNSASYFKEASDVNNLVDTALLTNNIKPLYFDLCARLYENLESHTGDAIDGLAQVYRDRRGLFLKLLLSAVPPGSYEYEAALIDLNQLNGTSLKNTISERYDLILRYKPDDEGRAIQYAKMGDAAMSLQDYEAAVDNLAMSMIYDIREGSRDIRAIHKLVAALNNIGNNELANELVSIAREDAAVYGSLAGNSDLGIPNASQPMDNYDLKSGQRQYLLSTLTLSIIFFIIVSILFYELHVKNKRLKVANAKIMANKNDLVKSKEELHTLRTSLDESKAELEVGAAIKDDYICQLLAANTAYVNSVEEKCKTLLKLMKEGSVKESRLLRHFGVKEERQRILQAFDATFLKLFPDFLPNFNLLFPDNERILPCENGELPMEVRIFALIRLGITDTEEIARYLNLTVNTVYVYKTKMKSRSIVGNADFEKRLMAMPLM